MKTLTTLYLQLSLLLLVAHAAAGSLQLLPDGRLSVTVENVPLREVLFDLQAQGVLVRIDPRINPMISASFTNAPAERVFASILKAQDYSLVWKKTGTGLEEQVKLAEIRVFREGGEHRTIPLTGSGSLEIGSTGDGIYFVRNHLLIHLTPGTEHAQLLKALEAVGGVVDGPVNGFGIVRVMLPDTIDPIEAAEILSAQEGIDLAEPDYAYRVDRPDLAVHPVAPGDGTPFTPSDGTPVIAVLDSGIGEAYSTSPFVASVYDAVARTSQAADYDGHGTQMSLIASGAVSPIGTGLIHSPGQPVVSVRIFDENGYTSNSTLMSGIEYASAAGASIISMSWGTEQSNAVLQKMVEHAAGKEMVLIAAAGNSPTGEPVYPAAYEQVIGVGALNPDGSVWEQSNYGNFVSVYAPGFARITSEDPSQASVTAGTSIATAYTAFRVAEIMGEQLRVDLKSFSESP